MTSRAIGSDYLQRPKELKVKAAKVIAAEEAVNLIKSNDTITVSGITGGGYPEKVISALELRFLTTGEPVDLTLFDPSPTGLGDGFEHLMHDGLLKRVYESFFYSKPAMRDMIKENRVEAYTIPLGSGHHLIHEIAAGRPFLTKIGLHTTFDPRNGGGKLNSRTTEDINKVVTIDGEEYLQWKLFPINVAIVRGWVADVDGNISFLGEPLTLGGLRQVMAAKACGGKVIAQAKQLVNRGDLTAREIHIPGFYVDAVVIDPEQSQDENNPGKYRDGVDGLRNAAIPELPKIPLDDEKVMGRRACMELKPGQIINTGAGPGAFVPGIALQEGIQQLNTFTIEHGNWGGITLGRGRAMFNYNWQPSYDDVFDFYSGGGLDITFLGIGQIDKDGNVNLDYFNDILVGVGGALDISFNAKKVVFTGPFTAGKRELKVADGKLHIIKEGPIKKFVGKVDSISISSVFLKQQREGVLYVTERCVFRLTAKGPELIEVAPGIDVEKDIIQQMEFRPLISPQLRTMDERLFRPGKMGLAKEALGARPKESARN